MAERAQREPMSKVDTAWLRMERPTNLMMITGVMMFAGPLALVFNRLFFPAADPLVSLLLSYTSFAVPFFIEVSDARQQQVAQ